MGPLSLIIIYCLFIVAASLFGGMVPMLVTLTHRRMQFALSLVAGFMLGVGLLHMLGHALEMSGNVQHMLWWMLAGFLVMFFIERYFCFHHHDVPEQTDGHAHDHNHEHHHHHDHSHDHHHDDPDAADAAVPGDHTLSGSGAAIGLAVHSIINGVALASAVSAESHHVDANRALAGLAVFLVIVLHKPFDALTIVTLATAGGWSKARKHGINALFSLAVPLGALIFLLGFGSLIRESTDFVAAALAFSSGTFMCISMSDLLPELQFHHHDRGKLSAALLVGLALAWAVGIVEHQMHGHDHQSLHPQEQRQVEPQDPHAGHNH